MAGTEEFIEGSFTSGEKLNYRLALLFQINRIGSAPSRVRIKLAGRDDVAIENFRDLSKENAADALYDSVLIFSEMLSPYRDDKYKTEKAGLENTPDPIKKNVKKYEVLDNWKETNQYSMALFGILMRLMRRKNLLLQEEGEDVVE